MTFSMSREELVAWAGESGAFHRLNLTRMSTVLLAQAYLFQVNRVFALFDLTHPIKVLEGAGSSTSIPPADQFRYAPLTDLYKIHFTSPRFFPKNLLNFMRSKKGGRYFQNAWDEAVRISDSQYINKNFIDHLSHYIVFGSVDIKNNSNEMTGEWVVFHRHEGLNYYLTFALHIETNDEIYNRIVTACELDNFPFRL